MNMTDSKQAILRLWDTWWPQRHESRKPNANDMSMFYLDLEQDHPEVLRFRTSSGDRWQDVRAWLNTYTGYGRG